MRDFLDALINTREDAIFFGVLFSFIVIGMVALLIIAIMILREED